MGATTAFSKIWIKCSFSGQMVIKFRDRKSAPEAALAQQDSAVECDIPSHLNR